MNLRYNFPSFYFVTKRANEIRNRGHKCGAASRIGLLFRKIRALIQITVQRQPQDRIKYLKKIYESKRNNGRNYLFCKLGLNSLLTFSINN